MSQIAAAWGAGPTPDYESLAARFRPLFERIRHGAVEREVTRALPFAEVCGLQDAGFTALRVPREQGGSGITLPELFNLLIELAEADSNLTQSLRGHLGFVENVLASPRAGHRERWLPRLGRGETVGPARSEAGDARRDVFTTTLSRRSGGWRLDGTKFYTTGSLYSDWINVGVTGPEGEAVSVIVRRDDPGVEVVDDWSGFGQTLTASGTARFADVAVDPADIVPDDERFAYSQAFFQLVHLATLAGIGRAMSGELARAVAARRRTFSSGNAARVGEDPQILQIVGRVRGAAYCAGAIALKNAEALQRVHDAWRDGDEAALAQATVIADLEVSQAQTTVIELILDASTLLFDALGASATLRSAALDRFWRNARTLASHNPRVYKERIVGDYAVNGTPPPGQWRIGVA